jgi:LysR family transcriptional regulator, pca operon transcriptional activator
MIKPALTFRQLECIEAVAKLGSTVAAAKAIGISQGALKQNIKSLETALGVSLFDRKTLGLETTPYARLFLNHIDAIRVELAETAHEFDDTEILGNQSELRVCAGIRSCRIWVKPAVERFTKIYPKARVTVDIELLHLYDRLMRNEVDLGVTMTGLVPEESRHIRIEPFGQWRTHFIVRPDHPLAHLRNLPIERLRAFPLAGQYNYPVMMSLLGDQNTMSGQINITKGWCVKGTAEDSFQSVMDLVHHDDCIALLPRASVKNELARGELVSLNLDNKARYFCKFILVYRNEEATSLTLRRFINHLKIVEAERASEDEEN